MRDISLPEFEGPLELLLRLIEREEMDITTVSLVAVTDQYLAAVRLMDGDHVPALASFVAIGAKLIYLKSLALLPRPAAAAVIEAEEEDVGAELVELLREYQRYRPVAAVLAERQEAGLRAGPRPTAVPVPPGAALHEVTLEALRRLMLEALQRKPEAPAAQLAPEATVSLRQRIHDLRARLRTGERLSFLALVTQAPTRADVIVTFMAVLELLKAGVCDARQSQSWEDIEIVPLGRTIEAATSSAG
jgi:segregation and condensation protein A